MSAGEQQGVLMIWGTRRAPVCVPHPDASRDVVVWV